MFNPYSYQRTKFDPIQGAERMDMADAGHSGAGFPGASIPGPPQSRSGNAQLGKPMQMTSEQTKPMNFTSGLRGVPQPSFSGGGMGGQPFMRSPGGVANPFFQGEYGRSRFAPGYAGQPSPSQFPGGSPHITADNQQLGQPGTPDLGRSRFAPGYGPQSGGLGLGMAGGVNASHAPFGGSGAQLTESSAAPLGVTHPQAANQGMQTPGLPGRAAPGPQTGQFNDLGGFLHGGGGK